MGLFEGISSKLQATVNKLKGTCRVTEKDIKEISREIKLALLEADVNFKVVKDFISKVTERALRQEVLESLTPGQQVIKVLNEELIDLLGKVPSKINFSHSQPTIVMIVGLQGSGKTTLSGKLAVHLRKQGKKPLLVACDIYRPAAIKQLQVVSEQVSIPVFTLGDKVNPIDIAKSAVEYVKNKDIDILILDTAGRLHIDEVLMDELKNIKSSVKPHEIMLVVDSMTGQDAVNIAENFNNKLGIDSIALTKLDGDTRGGAALSVKAVTGKPIKFVGLGEKINSDGIEPFYPDRIASRILGMGDVLSLIEKAQESFDQKKALELERKMRSQQFTLEDFLEQMVQLRKMGPLSQVLGMMPGMNTKALQNVDVDEKKMLHMQAIIQSMTRQERNDPSIINASRRKRIAAGSGTSVQEVNSLLKNYEEMKKMMKMMMQKTKCSKKGGGMFKLPF